MPSVEPNAANSGTVLAVGVLLGLIGACQPRQVPPELPSVLVVTTDQVGRGMHHPRLEAGRVWELQGTSRRFRPDLATLLTGRPPAEHGVVDPITHGLAVPLPATFAVDPAGVEDWAFEQDALVTWAPAGTVDLARWREAHPAGQVVLVGPTKVVWLGDPPAWPDGAVQLLDVGRAIRAAQVGVAAPSPAVGPAAVEGAPVLDRTVPWRERRKWSRLDTDLAGSTGARGGRELRQLTWTAEALDARRLREAEERLDSLDADGAAAIGLRAEWHDLAGRPFEGMVLREERFEQNPSPSWALELADRWAELRQPERARRWYLKVLELDPGEPNAEYGLWRLDGDEARLARLWVDAPLLARRAEVEVALERGEPAEDSDDPVLQARVLWSRGLTHQAVERLEDRLRDDPRSIPVRVLRATWALELGNPRLTERLLAPVARWMPEDRALQALLAEAQLQQAGQRAAMHALRQQWRQRW